ncbi:unnamed protein product [Durusdinium trenchii]|uniref:Arf-GAP domain-containing protein n=1 Tax=Durusdinium trenchii TaxID=1381693 RepID=A0ABP0IHM5_9DINO
MSCASKVFTTLHVECNVLSTLRSTMESFLRVVGFAQGDSLCEAPVKSKKPAVTRFDEINLPDLAHLAAGMEPCILQLEEEARSLEKLLLIEAQDLVQRWTQALKRRVRQDETRVSFKAQFLRSNALEKALEALRRNERLKQELFDRPLFAAADEAHPSEVFLAELRSLLQLCLPKCAVPLVEPTLQAVFGDPCCTSEATAALTALRALKEDWREAVQMQAARGLEMRLDALTYQLQKSPEQSSSRGFSRDKVHVLALLLQALSEWRNGIETHSAEIDSALLALGLKSPGSAASRATDSTRAESKSRSRTSSVISESEKSGPSTESSSSPSVEECHAAVEALALKTEQGVRRGLRLLGLPNHPLHFVPGCELRLRGHDIRVAVCSLIHHWRQDERAAFADVLLRIQQILSTDDSRVALKALSASSGSFEVPSELPELQKLRETLVAERQSLLEKLEGVEEHLSQVDEKLRTEGAERAERVVKGGPLRPRESTAESGSTSDSVALAIQRVAESLSSETQRSLERLGTQVQQRRSELMLALRRHLNSESERLSALAVAPGGSESAVGLAMDALQEAAHENRQLCERVQKVVGLDSEATNGRAPSELCSGSRCRARWMDGNYYDATIHAVLPGGFVVVNWLRPRPNADGNERPIRTISGIGGDDTLHRIVQTADVEFDALAPDVAMAFATFRDRPQQDRRCVDCDSAETEWASVSFGTYLCARCAEEHVRMGPSRSLVRQLNDGWGWTKTELKYMTVGGNGAFRASMDQYPALKTLSASRRYETRFAEYYRKHLDALCIGAQLPPAPTAPEQPGLQFTSSAEAFVLAQEATQQIEDAAQAASAQCSVPQRSCSLDGPLTRPRVDFEAPRSMSKSRRRKVSC